MRPLLALAMLPPLCALPARAQDAYLEVASGPGARISLDGAQGVDAGADGRVLLRDVGLGVHRLDAIREGWAPQSAVVEVSSSGLTRVALRPWIPLVRSIRDGSAVLTVEALPSGATLSSARLGWDKLPIHERPLVARVPAARHRLTLCNEVKCIDFRAAPRRGQSVHLMIDFEEGQVRDLSAARRTELAELDGRCARLGERRACLEACDWALAIEPGRLSSACQRVLSPEPRMIQASSSMVLPEARTASSASAAREPQGREPSSASERP